MSYSNFGTMNDFLLDGPSELELDITNISDPSGADSSFLIWKNEEDNYSLGTSLDSKVTDIDSHHVEDQETPFTIGPSCRRVISINIKTQIQTNRRTNIYLNSNWAGELVNQKIPVYYYPPIDQDTHEVIRSVEDPSQLLLTEMLRQSNGATTYLEVQFWLKTSEGKMRLIQHCENHPSLIKMARSECNEKALSLEETKWTKDTIVFGVNFNCTRTCFKSEMYVFVRVRCGDVFYESTFLELPFRRSEKKRRHDHNPDAKKLCKKHPKQNNVSKPVTLDPRETRLHLRSKGKPAPITKVPDHATENLADTCTSTSISPPSPVVMEMPYLISTMIGSEVLSSMSSPAEDCDCCEGSPITRRVSEGMASSLSFTDLLNLEFWRT